MKITPKGLGLASMVLVIALSSAGCQRNDGSRQYLQEDGKTTVVIDNLENVLPKEGAALAKYVIEGFKAYDFLDDSTLLGYRYSEAVFGEDRGIWTYDLGNKNYIDDLKVDVVPKVGSLSKDKSKLLIIPENPGETEKILLKQMSSGKTEGYKIEHKTYLYSFNWQYSGDGITSVSSSTRQEQVLRILPEGTLKKYTLPPGKPLFLDANNLQGDAQYLYYSIMENQTGSINRMSWETQKVETVLSDVMVTLMRLSPKGDQFAVVEGFEEARGKCKLTIFGTNGKEMYTIFEAIGINQVYWQPDGLGLAFTALNEEGLASLYHADLVSGQLHFLGEYPGYSIEYMAFDSKSNQLMLSYLYRGQKVPKWTTEILTLKRDKE